METLKRKEKNITDNSNSKNGNKITLNATEHQDIDNAAKITIVSAQKHQHTQDKYNFIAPSTSTKHLNKLVENEAADLTEKDSIISNKNTTPSGTERLITKAARKETTQQDDLETSISSLTLDSECEDVEEPVFLPSKPKRRPKLEKPKVFGKVIMDFVKKTDKQVTVNKGEIVEIVKCTGKKWWQILKESSVETGNVPAACIMKLDINRMEPPVPPKSELTSHKKQVF